MWTIFPQHSACRVFPTILPSFIHPYFHHPIFSVTTHPNFQVSGFNPSLQRLLLENPFFGALTWHGYLGGGWTSLFIWKNMSQIGNLPQVRVKTKNIRNHHPVLEVCLRESPAEVTWQTAAWCLGRRTARGTRFAVVPPDLGPGTFHLLSLPHATDDGWRLRDKTPRLKEIPTITEWLGNHWVHFKGRKPSNNIRYNKVIMRISWISPDCRWMEAHVMNYLIYVNINQGVHRVHLRWLKSCIVLIVSMVSVKNWWNRIANSQNKFNTLVRLFVFGARCDHQVSGINLCISFPNKPEKTRQKTGYI